MNLSKLLDSVFVSRLTAASTFPLPVRPKEECLDLWMTEFLREGSSFGHVCRTASLQQNGLSHLCELFYRLEKSLCKEWSNL